MQERLGSLKCIDIIRKAYFRSTISGFLNTNEKALFVEGGTDLSLEDYCQAGLKITFTDINAEAVDNTKELFENKNYRIENNCCSAYMLPYEIICMM